MLSHPEFGPLSTATEAAKSFGREIKGSNVVITGVSPNSLGEALAVAVARHQPRVLVLASRTRKNLDTVRESIHKLVPDAVVEIVMLDLSSLVNVRAAAAAIRDAVGGLRVDVLFNNAGINISERKLTGEGTEMQFATNHLGGFLLTSLLGRMERGGGIGRVVVVSSEAHRISPVRFSDLNLEPGAVVVREEEPRRGMERMLRGGGGYEPMIAYAQSKSANVLFTVGLQRRGMLSFAVNPGNIMTGLVRDLDAKGWEGLRNPAMVWKTNDQGAATFVVAGFDPKLSNNDGIYLDDCQFKRPSKWASDIQNAERLWRLSEDLVGERFVVGKPSRL